MLSESFMKFLLNYGQHSEKFDEYELKELTFRSVKVQEAAKVVVATIKDSY